MVKKGGTAPATAGQALFEKTLYDSDLPEWINRVLGESINNITCCPTNLNSVTLLFSPDSSDKNITNQLCLNNYTGLLCQKELTAASFLLIPVFVQQVLY